jgi:hypothetical protein
VRVKYFFLIQSAQTSAEEHPASYSMGARTRGYYSGDNNLKAFDVIENWCFLVCVA